MTDLIDFAAHQDAWELAKKHAGVTDVGKLTPQEFSDLVALAEEIRRGNVDVSKLKTEE